MLFFPLLPQRTPFVFILLLDVPGTAGPEDRVRGRVSCRSSCLHAPGQHTAAGAALVPGGLILGPILLATPYFGYICC